MTREEMTQKKHERIKAIFEDYKATFSYREVAKKHGISFQRVEQIINYGINKKIFTKKEIEKYKLQRYLEKVKNANIAEIRRMVKSCVPLDDIAKKTGIYPAKLRQILDYYKIRIPTPKERVLILYRQLWKKIRRQPTTTHIQRGYNFCNSIFHYYGSFQNFLEENNLPTPPRYGKRAKA